MTRLNAIPCNVITGFLGVGKTTCIMDLLKQKPESERWAILVNEFGEIGLDGQLLEHADSPASDVYIREVPGGCMCCSSGVPMQIALNQLLMKARPDRLLIEPTGLGHPQEVIRTLRGEHFTHVLSLQNTLTLVNPKHFTSTKHLQNPTFQQQLDVADILVANKTDLASDEEIKAFKAYLFEHNKLSHKPYRLTEKGHVPLDSLGDTTVSRQSSSLAMQPNTPMTGSRKSLFKPNSHQASYDDIKQQELPDCGYLIEAREADGFISIGWRIDRDRYFDLESTLPWLNSLKAVRIKALLHCKEGWASINASREFLTDSSEKATHSNKNNKPATSLNYTLIKQSDPTESRLEMIFENGEDAEQCKSEWQQCLLPQIWP